MPSIDPGRLLAVLVLGGVALHAPGCSIQRIYLGSEIRAEATDRLIPGVTRKAEVLDLLGPPDHVVRQFDGDLFLYLYLRKNQSIFRLREPVITRFQFFSYTKLQSKSDRLVVLFDRDGIVRNFGYRKDTGDLDAL